MRGIYDALYERLTSPGWSPPPPPPLHVATVSPRHSVIEMEPLEAITTTATTEEAFVGGLRRYLWKTMGCDLFATNHLRFEMMYTGMMCFPEQRQWAINTQHPMTAWLIASRAQCVSSLWVLQDNDVCLYEDLELLQHMKSAVACLRRHGIEVE